MPAPQGVGNLRKKDFCHIVNLVNLMYLCAITQKNNNHEISDRHPEF